MENKEAPAPVRGPFDLKELLDPARLTADPTVWSLVGANLATIAFAILEHWNIRTVLWLYWWQSVVIGFFNVVKILLLREFTTENFKLGNTPARPTTGTKVFTAFFFLFHFGFFHLIYAIFLSSGLFGRSAPATHAPAFFDLNLAIFFANGLFTFLVSKEWAAPHQNIGTVMFAPYYRIVPMHLTIIFAGFFGPGAILYFFLLLKTGSDLISHVLSRRINTGN